MAKGAREVVKMRLDSSIAAVDKVLGYLIEIGELHREHHPDVLEQYKTIYAFFEQGKALLEGEREVC